MRRQTWIILVVAAMVLAATTNGLAKVPQGMFQIYEQNKTLGIGNYITEDFILLSYGMVVNTAVTRMEETVFYPEFMAFVNKIKETFPELKSSEHQSCLDFLNVLAALLSGDAGDGETPEVFAELKQVRHAGGMAMSPLMHQKIDYTQFRIRGKYTRSEELGRYFQAMKYAGGIFFPVLESNATGISPEQADFLTEQALWFARNIHENKTLLKAYQGFEKNIQALFGRCEDLTLEDYYQIDLQMEEANVADKRKALLALARDTDKQPSVISGPVRVDLLEKGVQSRDVLTGWRFIPQRYTPDRALFQKWVYDQVQEYKGEKKPFSHTIVNGRVVKGYPLGLELMSLLGSEVAEKKLEIGDEINYQGYKKGDDASRAMLLGADGMKGAHFQLMTDWLVNGKDVQADDHRRLNSCLAFWTYTSYISQLYTKQSYTSVSKGLGLYTPSQKRNTAWLEPASRLYEFLESRITVLQSIVKESENLSGILQSYAGILNRCRKIADQEVANQPLKDEDIEFLNTLDATLSSLIHQKDFPIVVDVHTEPTAGKVLEEGLGYPRIVEKKMQEQSLRGALFSYYEFKYPINSRLTDENWQLLLSNPERMGALEFSPGTTIEKD